MKVAPFTSNNLLSRLWLYQAERFPVFGHGLLIAAFSFSALGFSILLRGQAAWPRLETTLVAFTSAFLFFFQLRIADEFKDFEEDARYRPYRPVPRGLVSLRELTGLGFLSLLVQLGLALWLEPRLVLFLLLVWGYMGLMSQEFFVRNWLKLRPLVYMASHMLIVPLIDLYTTACDWLVAGVDISHSGLFWFLVTSFFNGVVIELGRKIRAPQDEEAGVETYSALWGPRRAALAWLGALLLTALCALLAAREIAFAGPVGGILTILLIMASGATWRFLQAPTSRRAKFIETMSGLWTVIMYLSVGAVPLALKILG